MLNLDHLKSFYGEYPIGDPDINTTTNSDVLLNSREILEYYKSKKYSSILDTTRGVNEFINALTYISEEKDENGNVIHYQNDPRNIFLKDYTSLIARLLKTTGTQKYFELIDILYHAHLMDTDFTESELSATEYIYANPHKIKRIETRATWFIYRKIRANEFYGDSIKMSCQFILPYSMNLKSYDIKLEYIANERYDAPTASNEVSIRELKLLVEIHEKPGDHKDNENDYNKLAIASFHRYSVVYFPQNKFVTVEDYEARWKELHSEIMAQFLSRSPIIRTDYFRSRVIKTIQEEHVDQWDPVIALLKEADADVKDIAAVVASKQRDIDAITSMTDDLMNRLYSFRHAKFIKFEEFIRYILKIKETDIETIDEIKKIAIIKLPLIPDCNFDLSLSWEKAVDLLGHVEKAKIIDSDFKYPLDLSFRYTPKLSEEIIAISGKRLSYLNKDNCNTIVKALRSGILKDAKKNYPEEFDKKRQQEETFKVKFKVDQLKEENTELKNLIVEHETKKVLSKFQIITIGYNNLKKLSFNEIKNISKKQFKSLFDEDRQKIVIKPDIKNSRKNDFAKLVKRLFGRTSQVEYVDDLDDAAEPATSDEHVPDDQPLEENDVPEDDEFDSEEN